MLVLLLLLQGYEHLFRGYIIVPLDGYACHELKVAPRESANEIWLGDLNARRGHAGSELWSWLDNLFGQGPQLSRPPLCMHALSIIFLLDLRSTYGALRSTRPPTYGVHGLPCTYLLALFCFSICLLISCFPAFLLLRRPQRFSVWSEMGACSQYLIARQHAVVRGQERPLSILATPATACCSSFFTQPGLPGEGRGEQGEDAHPRKGPPQQSP